MARHLTVVYTINDERAFAEVRARLMAEFGTAKGRPWAVTAMSIDHEIARLEHIERALADRDLDLALEILGRTGIGDIDDLGQGSDLEALRA